MNFMLHISLCTFLALCVVGIYIYRHWLENHQDPYIHLHNDGHDDNIINAQTILCKRCEMVDKIKYAMLAATVVYALAIAGMGVYSAWNT